MLKPFSYFGGKQRLAPKLLPLIPPHTRFVEAFGGSASLLVSHPESPEEVYNDLDTGLADFFRILQTEAEFAAFRQRMVITPYSRELYYEYMKSWDKQTDRVERVSQWYLLQVTGYAGRFAKSWGMAQSGNLAKMFKTKVDTLPALKQRFTDVAIHNESWEPVLDRYDSGDTFFYLDPPYTPDSRKAGEYDHEMDAADHERLVERLQTLNGKCLLSGYANPIYEALPWRRFDTQVLATSLHPDDRDGVRDIRTEVVWMNYDPLFTRGWTETT